MNATQEPEYTGFASSYYIVQVRCPASLPEPYQAECLDIIEALRMDFYGGRMVAISQNATAEAQDPVAASPPLKTSPERP